MLTLTRIMRTALLAAVIGSSAIAAGPGIPAGASVYIAPMGGFETSLKEAIEKKKVPVTIVEQRQAADYELSGSASSQKATTAKKIIMLDWHSTEEASIKLADIKSSEVVFAYSVYKASSAHGSKSSAEACAKHLKAAIQTSKK